MVATFLWADSCTYSCSVIIRSEIVSTRIRSIVARNDYFMVIELFAGGVLLQTVGAVVHL